MGNKKHKECEGCICYYYNSKLEGYHCSNGVGPRLSKTILCPCSTCLIKMVCETECEKFASYMVMTHYPDKKDDKNGRV